MRKKLILIGAKGKMAQRFLPLFQEISLDVIEKDLSSQNTLEEITPLEYQEAAYIWISVPMEHSAKVAQHILPFVAPQTCICDVNSIKHGLFEVYKNYPNEILSLHPMFGPFVQDLAGQKMIVCRQHPTASGDRLLSLFQEKSIALHATSAEEHDRMMSIIQVLIHFNKMVVASVLESQGTSLRETLKFTSPIYRLELSVIARMFAQPAGLYAHIQTDNPFAEQIRKQFIETAENLALSLDSGEHKLIEDLFKDSTEFFSDFSAEGLKLGN